MAPHAENGNVSSTSPTSTETITNGHTGIQQHSNAKQNHDLAHSQKPLELEGTLEKFQYFDVTPMIGLSRRGVVFFRSQNDLTDALQKQLIQRLGELSGKPSTSGLHIHPVENSAREHGTKDDEISVISSLSAKALYKDSALDPRTRSQSGKGQWHSDITFEPVPSDYTALRLTELPQTGGDTLWASGYELFDRISPPYQRFLEGLTATYAQPLFQKAASDNKFELYSAPRGSPDNFGSDLRATHPVIRTNPVTGWKSVFAVGHHVQKIDDLAPDESKSLLDWFVRLIVENHDLQVRNRWQNANDLAIWDNRSVYHAATPDYAGYGERKGHRVVGLGERPYYDPKSKSRREALADRSAGNRLS